MVLTRKLLIKPISFGFLQKVPGHLLYFTGQLLLFIMSANFQSLFCLLPLPLSLFIVNEPLQGLADALSQIRERGCQERGGEETDTANREEHYLQMYLNDELQSVSCLKYWQKQDKDFGNHKVKGALCRLARFDFFIGFIYSHFTLL